MWGGFGGVSGVPEVSRGLHLTWLYNANWLFTTLIIQKYKEIPTFSWRIQNGWQDTSYNIYPMMHLGGPLAKVGLSAKFGVAVFKASILDSPGGSICQSMFVCQVLCTSIQGIYSWFTGGVHLPKYVCLPSVVYWYSRHLFSIHQGVHLPVDLPIAHLDH